jgi:membrane glycosyltransferase
VLALALGASALFYRLVRPGGVTILEGLALVLFVPLFGNLVFGFLLAGAGFIRGLLDGSRPPATSLASRARVRSSASRTALVMVIRHEDVSRVQAGVRAMYRSLAASGSLDPFTIFILSDSTDLGVAAAEEQAVHALNCELDAAGRLVYRRRSENSERKSGNLADFCNRWGAAFEYMVVLDADSLLDGETIREIVHRMDRCPNVGILQVPTRPVNRSSLFGRIQQFAASVYGPLTTDGLDFWLGSGAPYWGHNAILRVAPFMAHCRLPRLSGREPFGGEILSHDVVEAALMRRGGWEVRLAADLGGSYEEVPANLIAHAARDRRWCQGNLQHLRLVFTPGFRLASRLTFVVGALSYLCAPAWAMFVLLVTVGGTPAGLLAAAGRLNISGLALSASDRLPTLLLLNVMLVLLFLPKVLALVRLALVPGALSARGGLGVVIASVAAESIFAVLVTPVLLAFQTQAVLAVVGRTAVGWGSQARGDTATSVTEALNAHAAHTLGGTIGSAIAYLLDPHLFVWLVPTLAGLALSIPLSIGSSRAASGRLARRWGLFLIPEELSAPPLLRAFQGEDGWDRGRARPSLDGLGTATHASV